MMTKKELIEAIKDYPDDLNVTIWCGHDCPDPEAIPDGIILLLKCHNVIDDD